MSNEVAQAAQVPATLVPAKKVKIKKLSPKQHIKILQQQLTSHEQVIKDQTESINTLVSREQDISRVLKRQEGEHPYNCAERAARERSQLADKVLRLQDEQTRFFADNSRALAEKNFEIERLSGQLKAVRSLLNGASDSITLALPPKNPPAPMPSTGSDLLD
jgi:uncharacterized coiled-coil protein SlyX